MSEASEFRRYADEALSWAANATTKKEKRSLMELARTWAQAATMSENPMLVGVNTVRQIKVRPGRSLTPQLASWVRRSVAAGPYRRNLIHAADE
jgi:hypothetical protein